MPDYANSYGEVQTGSGPDFPNVNYGVKFLKFDSDLVRGSATSYEKLLFEQTRYETRKNIMIFKLKFTTRNFGGGRKTQLFFDTVQL